MTEINELEVKERQPTEMEDVRGRRVKTILLPLIQIGTGTGSEKIELPEVRLVSSGEDGPSSGKTYGPDRARAWKKASEWVQEIVIDQDPLVEEKRYQNRVKAEQAYLYRREDPELYQWQDDEENLKKLRTKYSGLKRALVERIGRPTRRDFAELYPHEYEDPGLSERARRAVRDLKAVFGAGTVRSENSQG